MDQYGFVNMPGSPIVFMAHVDGSKSCTWLFHGSYKEIIDIQLKRWKTFILRWHCEFAWLHDTLLIEMAHLYGSNTKIWLFYGLYEADSGRRKQIIEFF